MPYEYLFEAKKLSPSAIKALKANDEVIVYHGTTDQHLLSMLNGLDTTAKTRRLYGGRQHAGLFVTPSFKTAKAFGSTDLVVELKTKARNLHGTDWNGRTRREAEAQGEDMSSWDDLYPKSFDGWLSHSLQVTGEPQALHQGIIRPKDILRVYWRGSWHKPDEIDGVEVSTPKMRDLKVLRIGVNLADPNLSMDKLLPALVRYHGYTEDRWRKALKKTVRRKFRTKQALATDLKHDHTLLGFPLGDKAADSIASELWRDTQTEHTMHTLDSLDEALHMIETALGQSDHSALYHVTFLSSAESIQSSGIRPNKGGSNFGGGYGAHSRGYAFYTEARGVNYWANRLEQSAEDQSDNPVEDGLIPVVLKVVKKDLDMQPDELGSRDSRYKAYMSQDTIKASDISIFDGSRFVPLKSVDFEDMYEEAKEAADYEEEDDGEVYVMPDYEVFTPSQGMLTESDISTSADPEAFARTLRSRYGIDLWLSPVRPGNEWEPGYFELDSIVVPKDQRGQGTGSDAMDDLVRWADKHELMIALTPSSDFGGSVTKLRKFYKRFGFVRNLGSNKDFRTTKAMLRMPE